MNQDHNSRRLLAAGAVASALFLTCGCSSRSGSTGYTYEASSSAPVPASSMESAAVIALICSWKVLRNHSESQVAFGAAGTVILLALQIVLAYMGWSGWFYMLF